MKNPIVFVLVLLIVAFVYSCTGIKTKPNWTQFQSNSSNQGALWVGTEPALQPKWTVDVGQVAYSSPVTGAGNTIYVGNLAGELVAVNPDGTIKWKVSFPESFIFSTPAVSVDGFGNIFVISTRKVSDNRAASTLHSVGTDGTVNWSFPFPSNGFTIGSPKISGFNVFVWVRASSESPIGLNELFVFDFSGNVADREVVHNCEVTIEGSSAFTDAIIEFFEDFPGEFNPPDLEFPRHAVLPELDPSVAIVYYPYGDPSTIVIVADDCAVRAFSWNTGSQQLTMLWNNQTDSFHYTSPAVFNVTVPDLLVIGQNERGEYPKSKVIAFDVRTGVKRWERGPDDLRVVTPVSLGGLVYVASNKSIRALDAVNGEIVNVVTQPSITLAPPAMSQTSLYVSLLDGIQSANFELSNYSMDARAKGGQSSPSVDKDGNVYMVTLTGQLRAYPSP